MGPNVLLRTSIGNHPAILARPAREIGADDQRAFADLRRAVRDGSRLLTLHRWFFFLPFCAVTSAVFVFSLYLPRQYKATTSFEIAAEPAIASLTSTMTSASFDRFRGTVEEELTSAELHGAVLAELGFKGGSRNLAAVRRALSDQLSVRSSAPSERVDVVQLSYTGSDPEFGRRFLDALKRLYIERSTTGLRDTMIQQCDYLRREYEQVRQDSLQAQREETQLRLENPYLNPADPGALSIRIAQLEAERRDLLLRRREYESEIASRERLLVEKEAQAHTAFGAVSSLDAPASDATREVISELVKLDSQISELRRSRGMTDQHPELAALIGQRESVNQRLAAQRAIDRQGLAETGGSIPNNRPEWQPEFARLHDAIEAQTTKLRDVEISLETNQFEIEQLQAARNEVFGKQEKFAEVAGRVQKCKAREAQLQATLAQLEPALRAVEQNRLIRFTAGAPAQVSDRPVAPNPTTVILFALFAGLTAAVIGLVLGEVFDQSFHSAEQVTASLNIPLLEVIDEIVTGEDRGQRFFRKGLLAHVFLIGGLLIVSGSGSLAYLCMGQPRLYDKVKQLPTVAAGLFGDGAPAEG
jgi:uncharacterized protein involved in exopolysaccharide biosynthesis